MHVTESWCKQDLKLAYVCSLYCWIPDKMAHALSKVAKKASEDLKKWYGFGSWLVSQTLGNQTHFLHANTEIV